MIQSISFGIDTSRIEQRTQQQINSFAQISLHSDILSKRGEYYLLMTHASTKSLSFLIMYIEDTLPHNSPFNLNNDSAYHEWRERKLSQAASPNAVEISSCDSPSRNEIQTIIDNCATHNFTLFRYSNPPCSPETALHQLGLKLHLDSIDANLCAEDNGLTQITVKQTDTDQTYIPYTNRPLGWHTDGYYNATQQQIHAWLLYCHQPAEQGGQNSLLDHDIAYIRLRDENPDWIRALMHPEAFIIPANIEGGQQIRPDHSGPVFSVSQDGRRLHMRYSARQRNIIWRNTTDTLAAAEFMLALLRSETEPFKLNLNLQKGDGVISNNILHNRTSFIDAADPQQKRLIYRARYYDFIR